MNITRVNIEEVTKLANKLEINSKDISANFQIYREYLKRIIDAGYLKGKGVTAINIAYDTISKRCEKLEEKALELAKILRDVATETQRIDEEREKLMETLLNMNPLSFEFFEKSLTDDQKALYTGTMGAALGFFDNILKKDNTSSNVASDSQENTSTTPPTVDASSNQNQSSASTTPSTNTTPTEQIPETKPAEKPTTTKPTGNTSYKKIPGTNQLESFDPNTTNGKSMGQFKYTAYCSCHECCGKWALNRPVDSNGQEIVNTASGTRAYPNQTIAVDPSVIPLGSKVIVERNGKYYEYTAQDTGSAIKGNKIDVYFNDHSAAWNFGTQSGNVYVIQ